MEWAPIGQWYGYLKDATARAARPIEYQQNTRQMLETAGFTDIQEQIIRAPFNSWPRDPYQKEIGRWYCVGLSEGLEAMSLGPLTRVYGWKVNAIKSMCEDVKAHMIQRKIHAYNNM